MTPAERAELDRLRQLEADERLPIAGKAWNAIKKSDDNEWINLPVDMQGKLNHLAEKALGGRPESEGDYAPAGFFAKVLELSVSAGDPIVDLNSVGVMDARTATGVAMDRRVGLADRRVGEFPSMSDPDRREGLFDRRGVLPVHLPVDLAEKSAKVNVNSVPDSDVPTNAGLPEFNADTFNSELRNQDYRYPPLAEDANETE